MKKYISSFIKYIFRDWIMNMPMRRFRRFCIRRVTKHIGKDVFFGMGVELKGGQRLIEIGDNSVINRNVVLDGRGRLIIGSNVDIGQDTHIWTMEHDPNDIHHTTRTADVIIEDYVWIAARVTILPNVRIGRGAVIGTGSIVTKDVPPMAIVAGVPAKVIGQRENPLTYTLNYKPYFF